MRPRFANLPPEQQEAIRSAARDEFAAHGFHAASLNRMIEAAAISKGSMYYYFDGKEDLFAHVAQVELEGLIARVGPFDVTTATTADAFWSLLADYYRELVSALSASPQVAALLRGWVAVAGTPAMQRAQQDAMQQVVPWMEEVLATGQRLGAVRDDVPGDLLIAVASGMGQAMDTWLLTRAADEVDLAQVTPVLMAMLRRALEP